MAKIKAPVKKNQTIDVEIEDLTHEGNGVGKVDGYPVFTPFVLPGEKAAIKIVKVNKKFAFGKLIQLHEQSQYRVEPPCNVFYKCGGCQIQHMSYDMQLEMKQNQQHNGMKKIAHLPDLPVRVTCCTDAPWSYRNTIGMPVGDNAGKMVAGFYRGRSHVFIDEMEACVIQDELGDRMLDAVRRIAPGLDVGAYDEVVHDGI